MRRVVPLAVLCLVGRPLLGQASRPELDAMLLPPVGNQLALWVNQPANFAVLGVAPSGAVDVLYQQDGHEAIPASGYVYVPRAGTDPDGDYEQVLLVASPDRLDLSNRSIDDVLGHASVADGYDIDSPRDSLLCLDPRHYAERNFVMLQQEQICRRPQRWARDAVVGRRGFFVVPRAKPHRTPDVRQWRWLGAKDQWTAITNHGETGTELIRSLGYVNVSNHWLPLHVQNQSRDVQEQVREIVNGAVGTLRGQASAIVMESDGRVSEVATANWSATSPDRWVASAGRGYIESRSAASASAESIVRASSASSGSSSSGTSHRP